MSKHRCWYPHQEATCTCRLWLQRVGSNPPEDIKISLCNCCFKLLGAQTAIPTISTGTNCRPVSRCQSRRYSILCEIRWYPACLAPCVTGKQEANQAPLDIKPAIHLSESAVALFPRVLSHPTMRSMQPVLSIASPSLEALSTIVCRRGSV